MRSVRSLSGIAGPGASLAQAGGGGVELGPRIAGALGHFGSYNDPTAYSFDISSLGHKAGDLLFVATYNFYGRATDPFITNPGFETVASVSVGTGSNKSILAMKVATGLETEVSSTYDGQFGIAVTAIRGASIPSAADISASYAYCENGASNIVLHPALSDTSFDYSLIIGARRDQEEVTLMGPVSGNDPWNAVSARLVAEGSNLPSMMLLAGATATDGFNTLSEATCTDAVLRIGLRSA